MLRLIRTQAAKAIPSDMPVAELEKNAGIRYDSVQIEAIRQALSAKAMVLTGGPGTGKTTVTQGIIKA